jgi:hypothetical protein
VFIAIGHTPNTTLFEGQPAARRQRLHPHPPGSRTSVPACSPRATCRIHVYRQAITAAGSGCMAAIDAERFSKGCRATRRERRVATAAARTDARSCQGSRLRKTGKPEPSLT